MKAAESQGMAGRFLNSKKDIFRLAAYLHVARGFHLNRRKETD
jgi:hypothetical protein